MAELLVRVVDKIGPTDEATASLTKRGDVIVVQEDGYAWSVQERKNPDWRILSVPGPASDYLAFLARMPIEDPTQPPKVQQPRAFRLNLDDPDVSKAGLSAFLADTARTQDKTTAPADLLTSAKVAVPVFEDVAVIGTSPAVMG